MRVIKVKWYSIIGFSILLFFTRCGSDPFKESCMKTFSILQNAKKLIKTSSAANIVREGKIEEVIIKHDNREAKEYLRSKEEELNKHYQLIKSYLRKSTERYNDVLYILALVNEMTYLFSGEAIEDRCRYIKIIRGERNTKLSRWVIDEVFGPFMNNEDTIKNWLDMEADKKREEIYDFLMVPGESGEKCID